ncbi:YjfB family protein [Bacillus sp. FJAT-47783]|uniref:YjfB family protein n=1 Tax=Bacillus sp. FJAT-47783 TaxID=2922712 RepID=UPI001FAC49D0|nr:YjfB family protein [Bacillus sp. FJAT-47783]
MDIAALSVMLGQTNVNQQASLSVMKMAMDTAEQNGQAMQQLLQTTQAPVSLEPHLGHSVDVKG